MKFQNSKIWIGSDPDLCKKVQEKLFQLGYTWASGHKQIRYLNETMSIIIGSKDFVRGNVDKESFTSNFKEYQELTLEELGIEEEKTEFVVGKWYKYNEHIGKFLDYKDGIFRVSEYIYNKQYYKNTSNWGYKDEDSKRTLLTDLSEIQEYLPERHPDLIIKEEEDLTGRYIKALVDKPDGGNVLEGEVGLITKQDFIYIYVDFPSQNKYIIGTKEINGNYEILPKDYSPEDSSIPEYVECISNEHWKGIGDDPYNFIVGKIYKWKELHDGTIATLNKNFDYWNKEFKISTKEAYDKQNSKSDMKAVQEEQLLENLIIKKLGIYKKDL